MLNIYNHLKKESLIKFSPVRGNSVRQPINDPAANKEWYNSVYTFDKNSTKFLPAVHNYVFKLLNRYFNMTNRIMENKLEFHTDKKIKRSSGRKIWVSTPEIKHLNDKLTITIYIYNRVYNIYKKKLNYTGLNWLPTLSKTNDFIDNTSIITKVKHIKTASSIYFINKASIKPSFYVKMIKSLKQEKHIKMEQYKLDVIDLLQGNDKSKILASMKLLNIERYDYLINQLKKELMYLKLKRNMLFNKFKFNELYFSPITNILQTIYKKKVIFNIVSLKNYFLNTSILSQITAAKIASPKFRGKSRVAVDNSMSKIKVPKLSSNNLPIIEKRFTQRQNIILNKFITKQDKDSLNQFLLANSSKNWSHNNIDNIALSNLKNKSLAGIFIKISGRLTRRFKAQRASSSFKSIGTLKNVYSAHKHLSSSLSRGYSNINVEKTLMHSKTRIGAFGLTGWISSY